MTTKGNNNGNIWPLLIGIFVFSAILQVLFGNNSTTTSQTSADYTPAPAGVDRSSFEHRYAKERVKLEGYSDKEAQQAADAITKFHNAQKNR
jgi:hypothetical protein